jgi:hypothetical protein
LTYTRYRVAITVEKEWFERRGGGGGGENLSGFDTNTVRWRTTGCADGGGGDGEEGMNATFILPGGLYQE